jgi:hypothetical protein
LQKPKRTLSLRPNKKLKKTSTMKKVFAILAVAGIMTACNSGENKEAATDSTATETAAPATTDSSAATTDSSAATTDSSAAAH